MFYGHAPQYTTARVVPVRFIVTLITLLRCQHALPWRALMCYSKVPVKCLTVNCDVHSVAQIFAAHDPSDVQLAGSAADIHTFVQSERLS